MIVVVGRAMEMVKVRFPRRVVVGRVTAIVRVSMVSSR